MQGLNDCIRVDNLENPDTRWVNSYNTTRQQLVLTLLFMNLVGVQRTWDLRSYSGDGLGLLTGRVRAYGYIHTERFLAQMAQAGAAEGLTDLLAEWTHRLWCVAPDGVYYLDGHKKAVYSDSLVPRSLVGRLGKILGCRALTLLMDAAGHPLLVLTARGDQHLTGGAPVIITRYEQTLQQGHLAQIIVDREGMGAAFLKALSADRIVISLLHADQYKGLESFSQVGEFVPVELDRDGKVLREVAPAQFRLAIPEQPGETLLLSVALVRDWRKPMPMLPGPDDERPDWDADWDWDTRWQWLQGQFIPTAAPTLPTQPKLIPIVSTAESISPVELAGAYRQRWVAQENIIRDFLLPLGLDTNHGYAKTPVENSEIAKRRATLQKRLDKARRQADTAQRQYRWNLNRSKKLQAQTEQIGHHLYAQLNRHYQDLWAQAIPTGEREFIYKQQRQAIRADLDQRWQQVYRARQRSDAAFDKYERTSIQQREFLRDLPALDAQERTMFELDNAKDQIMSVLKLMLVNLIMWTRDHCFPVDYAHATLTRLLPFFRLPGRILAFRDHVLVTLRPFNDRALNRDLAHFCELVNQAALCLPNGKSLVFRIADSSCLTSDMPP